MKWVFLVILIPMPLFSWNGSDHRLIGRHALKEAAPEWGLNRPVEVRPLKSLLNKISMGVVRGSVLRQAQDGERIDPWHFSSWLGIDPAIDIEKPVPELRSRETVTPLEILSGYAIDPDDGRDQNLFDRDAKGRPVARTPDQKWFGALEGPDSQAFRHIEKPPFSPKHPRSTFGFPLRSVGEASKRAEVWFLLSELAFELDEEYWGWRFLANSFHYLQDLHNPYHAGQITPQMLGKGLLAWWRWGREQEGFVGTFAHLISNSHRFFEGYVATPKGDDEGMKEEALRALEGSDSRPVPSVRELAQQIRDESNLLFPDLLDAVTRATDPRLLGPYRYRSDGNEADDPTRFLKKDGPFHETNRKIFAITRDRFAAAGTVMRSVVKKSVEERGRKSPKELIHKLNQILEYRTVPSDSE